VGNTITSESTETMISAFDSRTAWLMPLRLPMLTGFFSTRTFGYSRAALQAQV
jgi:hypothetical protein